MVHVVLRERFEADLELSTGTIRTDKYLWTRSTSSRSSRNRAADVFNGNDNGNSNGNGNESKTDEAKQIDSQSPSVENGLPKNKILDLQDVVNRLDDIQQLVAKLADGDKL